MPPPPPAHAVSPVQLPELSMERLVPPQAMTFGENAGYPPGAPLSPVAARNVTPCPGLLVKMPSYEVSADTSDAPKLIDTAVTPGVFLAVFAAAPIRSM